jgi:uncharacterized protein
MLWNVAGLLQDDVGATRHYELDEPPYEIDRGVVSITPLVGSIKLTRTNRGILADARVSTQLRQECSRCLEEVSSSVSARISEEFFPTVDLRTGAPVKRPDGDGYMLTDAHELDLREPIRQAILLEQPMQPLCQVDCRGLCSRCGQNQNELQCQCKPEPVDPRLNRLADWLKANQT